MVTEKEPPCYTRRPPLRSRPPRSRRLFAVDLLKACIRVLDEERRHERVLRLHTLNPLRRRATAEVVREVTP